MLFSKSHPCYLLLILSAFSCSSKEEAAPLLYVPDDLEVTIWASSPQFFNPTNLDVDVHGRIWLTEAVNYRDFRNADAHMVHEAGDRIVILEDTNGDGKADKSKVFIQDEDLRAPLGIAVVGNQVVVSCSPSIIIYTDEDGDDVPDRKEVFLTGFGGRDHDHGLHAGVLGPDGKWYFIAGNKGPHEVTDRDGVTVRAGSVYNEYTPYPEENRPNLVSDDGNIYTGGLIVRVNPDGTGLEVMSHNYRNAYEVAVDSFGNMWQSDNDDQTASCRTTWLMEGSNAGFFSATGDRTWQADRRPGQTVPLAHWHQYDPGVLPAGDIYGAGSPTGVVRIEGDELGKHYRGLLLAADAGRNIIFGYHPKPMGAGYSLEQREAFISSVDRDNTGYIWHELEDDDRKWFRPSDVVVGTDGALYVADWYDPIVGGHRMMDKEGYGRIYRIAPKGKKLQRPTYDLSTTDGLVEAMRSPALHVRAQAMDKLRAEGVSVVPAVQKLLDDPNPFVHARALFLLASLGDAGKELAKSFLQDANSELAVAAFRALRTNGVDPATLTAQVIGSGNPALYREAAISLRHLPFSQSEAFFMQLVEAHTGEDPWLVHALGIGLRGNETAFWENWYESKGRPDPVNWSAAMEQLAFELHPPTVVPHIVRRIQKGNLSPMEATRALTTLAFIPTMESVEFMRQLAADSNSANYREALWWLQFRKTNEWEAMLADWRPPASVLPPSQEPIQHLADIAADTLQSFADRLAAAEELAETSQGRLHLLWLVLEKRLDVSLMEAVGERVHLDNVPAVGSLMGRFFPLEDSDAITLESVLEVHADAELGRVAAVRHCGMCHAFGTSASEIGPNLSEIHLKLDRQSFIQSVLDPDDAIAFGSEAFLVKLKNGAMLYGILQSAGPVITVMEHTGRQYTLPASEVAGRKQLRHSLMPTPQAMNLDAEQLAHITAYMMQGSSGQ
ncbi:MAG: dehydrogenase [Lunatimonas sp.]|uniref:PVC-type heme-binding CxxCH protein n=1 Tax=Lunatimonas sp. TaxID=2060141 RepID=UPI00263A8D1E|nr:PVC-type heme-binding CxxCH protein [Lunatimonas sp.]MCC5937711.1 dehydrogenase [Lunatimonas sp.]